MRDKGIILSPTNDLTMEGLVDEDFTGLWTYEDLHNMVCVISHTGYLIHFSDVPVL